MSLSGCFCLSEGDEPQDSHCMRFPFRVTEWLQVRRDFWLDLHLHPLSLSRSLPSMSSDPPPPYPGGPSAPLIEEKNGQPGNKLFSGCWIFRYLDLEPLLWLSLNLQGRLIVALWLTITEWEWFWSSSAHDNSYILLFIILINKNVTRQRKKTDVFSSQYNFLISSSDLIDCDTRWRIVLGVHFVPSSLRLKTIFQRTEDLLFMLVIVSFASCLLKLVKNPEIQYHQALAHASKHHSWIICAKAWVKWRLGDLIIVPSVC